MKAECRMTKACLVGILSIALAGCSDSEGGDKNTTGDASGGAASGGAVTGGAIGSGGTQVGSGGTQVGSGGTQVGSGGAQVGSGGLQIGSGGLQIGSGGLQIGSGGLQIGSGGLQIGSGGLQIGSGGLQIGSGGNDPGIGGNDPGIGGNDPGIGGNDPGFGGNDPGLGGNDPGLGGNDPGLGGNDPGLGGNDPGLGGNDPGTGGNEAGSGGDDPGTGGTESVTVLLAGDDVNSNGPLPTTVEEGISFSGGGNILVRPTNITTEPNTKHPVAIWGPGGGTPPTDYLMLLERMASQGFVIVGIRESSGGSELMSAAIDWLEEQNADPGSPMYDRLILDRVGVFGHSMGGLSSEATIRDDSRVTTALLDNSGDLGHAALVDVLLPVGIIYGETGMERENAEGDYNNPGNKGPCWLGMMAGGGHGSGPWDGSAANVAWMRWHLGGENFRKDAFIGDGGDYNDRGVWTTQFKNWDGWKNWNE